MTQPRLMDLLSLHLNVLAVIISQTFTLISRPELDSPSRAYALWQVCWGRVSEL